ncbi:MAG: glycosyltransferase family 2 protein, partial [Candidatus Babeliales bacterium]
EKLQGMENRSTHIHYIPQFKFRDVRKNKEKDIFWNQIKNSLSIQEKKFVVIIASFNNKNWYKVNLDSILSQKYENYKVIYIDDNSTDGTGGLVKEYISAHKDKLNKILFIQNTVRCGATANIYKAIHSCDNDSIIVILDGDDWVKNDHVLALLNKVYSDPNIWLTYGQFERYPYCTVGYCSEIPEEVIKANSFRSYKWVSSHLRTFYAWLYKRIKLEDLMFDGEFVPVCSDLVTMFPMLEMAGRHFKFISDVLYVYNCINPNSYKNMYSIAKHDSNKFNNMHAIIEPYIRKQLASYAPLRESDLVKYN